MQIKLQQFEGPLDLLLGMIEERELDITEVSLAQVADQYVEYIEHAHDINPEEVANFLVVAARLLWIKSKALLPYLVAEDEEEEIKDFENQLRIYREFLEVAKAIEERLSVGAFMYTRGTLKLRVDEVVFNPPGNVTALLLQETYEAIAHRLRPREVLAEETVSRSVSIEERMQGIRATLKKMKQLSFSSLLEGGASRDDVVVNFIAMLELVKQKKVTAKQSALFSEIYMKHCS